MLRNHPLAWIPARARLAVFLPLLVLTLLLMWVFTVTGAALTTVAAPQGIVSFELARSTEQAEQIVASWDANARLRASFGLGLDYLFMPVYSTTIGLACVWVADVLKRRPWPLAGMGIPLAWGLWLAALCDGIENLALTVMLWHGVATPWPTVASVCASIKFALIAFGLVYALYGASAGTGERYAHREQTRGG